MDKQDQAAQVKEEAERIAKGVALLNVEMMPVSELKPYEKNSKIHDKAHIHRLKENIKHEGLQESLLVEEDGTIVAGHGRLQACIELGWEEIPVRVMKGYTKAQCMLHRVSSNLTVSNKYDSMKQAEELSEIQGLLKELDVSTEDLSAMSGYSERDLEVLTENITEMAAFDDLDLSLDSPAPEEGKKEEPEPEEESAVQKMVKLNKLFGFDEVTVEQSRTIMRFLTVNDIATGKDFEDYCSSFLEAFGEGEES